MRHLILVLIILTPSLCSAAGPMNFLCTVEETTGYVWRTDLPNNSGTILMEIGICDAFY